MTHITYEEIQPSTYEKQPEATTDLEIKGQGHKTIALVALPIYTYIPNLKVPTKIFFKLSRPKGNLCSGGGLTVLNPKYPRLSSRDTNRVKIVLK